MAVIEVTIYPGSRGSLRGKRNESQNGEPLVTSVANPTSTLDYGSEFESRM